MGKVYPSSAKLVIASWNVQGLSDIKLFEICEAMRRNSIGIICMQETRVRDSPYYTEDGFLLIFSGSSTGQPEFAGVGFIIAPWVKNAVFRISPILKPTSLLETACAGRAAGRYLGICASLWIRV